MRRGLTAALCAVGIACALPPAAHAGAAAIATDANLVTALDVSDSIMRHQEWIQFAGMIHALQSDQFLDAATAGRHGRIGFAVIVWSSGGPPDVVVPWTLIQAKHDIRRIVDRLAAARQRYGFDARMATGRAIAARRGDGGGAAGPARRTDVSSALDFAADLIRAAPFAAPRQVINICGNGVDNVQASPAAARDRALAAGMVVNGLAIGARAGVADHYRAQVQGGAGSFVLQVTDPAAVAGAMLEKFLRDLHVAREPPGRLGALPGGLRRRLARASAPAGGAWKSGAQLPVAPPSSLVIRALIGRELQAASGNDHDVVGREEPGLPTAPALATHLVAASPLNPSDADSALPQVRR